jgi:hypothetical protein
MHVRKGPCWSVGSAPPAADAVGVNLSTGSCGNPLGAVTSQAAAGQAAAEVEAVQQRLQRQTADMEACRAQVLLPRVTVHCDLHISLCSHTKQVSVEAGPIETWPTWTHKPSACKPTLIAHVMLSLCRPRRATPKRGGSGRSWTTATPSASSTPRKPPPRRRPPTPGPPPRPPPLRRLAVMLPSY